MTELITRGGVTIIHVAPDGPPIASDRDAVDLMASAYPDRADLVLIPVSRLPAEFFTLSTRLAGDIVQKFVNYRQRVAFIGDISAYLEASSALRDYVRETNRGRDVWFVTDLEQLDTQLARGGAAG
jgi:hypothetical protein